MQGIKKSLEMRIDSAVFRLRGLSFLRRMLNLPQETDLTPSQWSVLESILKTAQKRIESKIRNATNTYISNADNIGNFRKLNSLLGEVEFDIVRAYTFFDTYVDVLSQRNSLKLGKMLLGCDVLAMDAIHQEHELLLNITPPLVYCDRGFGAAVLREGVKFPGGDPNPIPLIQIPHSKLRRKYNLVSILHEVGHETIIRLGLKYTFPKMIFKKLSRFNVSDEIKDLFSLWTYEIGPDFWAFCCSGLAQTAGIKEILALPPRNVFRVDFSDPHPTPYIRVLLSFEWCRHLWGKGPWDDWKKEWQTLYPLNRLKGEPKRILQEAERVVPFVKDILFQAKLIELNNRSFPELFSISMLHPKKLKLKAEEARFGKLNLKGLNPCVQLAVFRIIRDDFKISEHRIDQLMSDWLVGLKKTKFSKTRR